MNTPSLKTVAVTGTMAAILSLFAACGESEGTTVSARSLITWQRDFNISQCQMQTIGQNPYFVLQPGYQLLLEGKDGNTHIRLQITVLEQTKEVDGIPTRVVEEREWKDGTLHEVARNYFAMCDQTNDVYYFGEDVDFYENGQITKHDGSWLAGNGNKPGLYMAGKPTLNRRYYQELAPKVAMDRAEITSLRETCKTPAGTFPHCLRIKEGSAIELTAKENKYYAPGIGFVGDDKLRLVKYGFINQKSTQ